MTVDEALHEFAKEVAQALRTSGRNDLAASFGALRIESRCDCAEAGCASFYTGPKPVGAWPKPHENTIVDVASGLVVLDVVQGLIRFVEVHDRPDVEEKLATVRLW